MSFSNQGRSVREILKPYYLQLTPKAFAKFETLLSAINAEGVREILKPYYLQLTPKAFAKFETLLSAINAEGVREI